MKVKIRILYTLGIGMFSSLSLLPLLFFPWGFKQQQRALYKTIREAKTLLSLQNTHTQRDKLWTSPNPGNTQTWRNRRYKAEALISLLSKQVKEGGKMRREWKDLVFICGWTCHLLLPVSTDSLACFLTYNCQFSPLSALSALKHPVFGQLGYWWLMTWSVW